MPNLTPSTKLSRAPEVLFSPLADGEGVLLSMEAGLYFSLNKTATAIWNTLDAECTLEQLARCLSRDFKVTPEQASEDLKVLLAEMIGKKLVLCCRG